jgi:hypothetical protein
LDSSMFSELPLPSLAKPSSKMFCPVYFRSVMNATTQSRSILALLSSSLPLCEIENLAIAVLAHLSIVCIPRRVLCNR